MRSKLALVLTGIVLGASSVALYTEYKKYKRFKETLEAETDFKAEAEAKAETHRGTCPFTKTACEFDSCDGCKNDIRPDFGSDETTDDVINTIIDLDPDSPSFDADLKRAHDKLDAVLDKYDIKKSDEPIYKGSDIPAEVDFDVYTDEDSGIEEVTISDASYSAPTEASGTSSFFDFNSDDTAEVRDNKASDEVQGEQADVDTTQSEEVTGTSDEDTAQFEEDTAQADAEVEQPEKDTAQEEISGTVGENEVPIFLENDEDEDISDTTL